MSIAPMAPGLAVQLFFVISGFYMAWVLDEKYASSTPLFYRNRILRLFPTYFVVLALTAIAVFALGLTSSYWASRDMLLSALTSPSLAPAIIATNLLMIGQDALFWLNVTPDGFAPNLAYSTKIRPDSINAWRFLLVPQAWSLSLELMFYALAPFIARRSISFLVTLLVASAAVRWGGDALDVSYHLWPRRFFPAELCLFLAGMLAWRLRDKATLRARFVPPAVLASLLVMIAVHDRLDVPETIGRTMAYIALPASLPTLHAWLKESRFDRKLGELSYPIYISHLLALATANAVAPHNVPLACLATLAVSVALRVFVEEPVDRNRQRAVKKAAQSQSSVATASPIMAAPPDR